MTDAKPCPNRTESFHPICCNRYMLEVATIEGDNHSSWTKVFACVVTNPEAAEIAGIDLNESTPEEREPS